MNRERHVEEIVDGLRKKYYDMGYRKGVEDAARIEEANCLDLVANHAGCGDGCVVAAKIRALLEKSR